MYYLKWDAPGANTCWKLEEATLEKKKIVHVDDVPPWNHQPVKTVPSCWNGQRHIAVNPQRLT